MPKLRVRIEELPDVLTVAEAAGALRLSSNKTYEAIRRGELPSVRIGRRLLVPKAGVLQLLQIADTQINVNAHATPNVIDAGEIRFSVSGKLVLRPLKG